MDDDRKERIEVMMKDYEIVKNYSKSTSPSIRYSLISMTLATLGIVVSGTMIAVVGQETLGPILTKIMSWLWLAFMPAFSLTTLYVWLGEEQRMMRMGEYLMKLEEKANEKLGEEILTWETFKRLKSVQYPEALIVGLFLGASLGSSILGLYFMKVHFVTNLVVDVVAHVGIGVLTFFFIQKHLRSAEKLEAKEPDSLLTKEK